MIYLKFRMDAQLGVRANLTISLEASTKPSSQWDKYQESYIEVRPKNYRRFYCYATSAADSKAFLLTIDQRMKRMNLQTALLLMATPFYLNIDLHQDREFTGTTRYIPRTPPSSTH